MRMYKEAAHREGAPWGWSSALAGEAVGVAHGWQRNALSCLWTKLVHTQRSKTDGWELQIDNQY